MADTPSHVDRMLELGRKARSAVMRAFWQKEAQTKTAEQAQRAARLEKMTQDRSAQITAAQLARAEVAKARGVADTATRENMAAAAQSAANKVSRRADAHKKSLEVLTGPREVNETDDAKTNREAHEAGVADILKATPKTRANREYYFSADRMGFFAKDLHGDKMPPDAVAISTETYTALLKAQDEGHEIQSDGQGAPIAVKRMPTKGDVAFKFMRDRAAALATVADLIEAHRDAIDTSQETTLSHEQYIELVKYRLALRAATPQSHHELPPAPTWISSSTV